MSHDARCELCGAPAAWTEPRDESFASPAERAWRHLPVCGRCRRRYEPAAWEDLGGGPTDCAACGAPTVVWKGDERHFAGRSDRAEELMTSRLCVDCFREERNGTDGG